jgi:transcriptional regulator with XRE-family HTH domain
VIQITALFVRNVAYLFKLTRVRRGWSLNQASTATGIHENAISRIEKGENQCNIETYLLMVRGYGLDYDAVFIPYTRMPSLKDCIRVDEMAERLGNYLKTKDNEKTWEEVMREEFGEVRKEGIGVRGR